MISFKNIDISNFNDEKRQQFLLKLIPKLKNFDKCEGKEGVAYFVGDNYVVKQYTNVKQKYMLESIFEAYCEESQRFAKEGFLMPQIYTWLKHERKSFNIFNNNIRINDYYILEEKIKGRELYFIKLSEFYNLFKDDYSYKKFMNNIADPTLDPKLYKQVAREMISDYMAVNSYIEAMPEEYLEQFIINVCDIYLKSNYSVADLHPKNVFISDDKLKFIDNIAIDRKYTHLFNRKDIEEYIAYSLIILFKSNALLEKNIKRGKGVFDSGYSEFDELLTKNRVICSAMLEKILNVMKKCVNNHVVNYEVINFAKTNLSKFLDSEDVTKCIKILNPNC